MNNNSGQPNGTLILVLGILSLVSCQILGPVAWIMGNNAMNLINSGQGDESQRSNVSVGRICGIIGTVLMIPGIIAVMLYFGMWGTLLAAGAAQGGSGAR